jgi:divalent metal cation (Fe/Co/Zn/Cd) transporter
MRSTLVGVVVNLFLALTKCTAGFLGHSFALIADGLESAADVITGLVVYLGLRRKQPIAGPP